MTTRITITLSPSGVVTHPKTVRIPLGNSVSWDIGGTFGALANPQLRIRFDPSPFVETVLMTTLAAYRQFGTNDLVYEGLIVSGNSRRPGEFKYDVQIVDASTGAVVDEEDPYIIIS